MTCKQNRKKRNEKITLQVFSQWPRVVAFLTYFSRPLTTLSCPHFRLALTLKVSYSCKLTISSEDVSYSVHGCRFVGPSVYVEIFQISFSPQKPNYSAFPCRLLACLLFIPTVLFHSRQQWLVHLDFIVFEGWVTVQPCRVLSQAKQRETPGQVKPDKHSSLGTKATLLPPEPGAYSRDRLSSSRSLCTGAGGGSRLVKISDLVSVTFLQVKHPLSCCKPLTIFLHSSEVSFDSF